MKRIAVLGAGGFIGANLVRFLKKRGCWVRGVDLKYPKWSKSPADEYWDMDLRYWRNCLKATKNIDEVYQLAADMGGIGFITKYNCQILHNNSLINVHTIEAARKNKIKKYFFSSSVCIYPVFLQEKIDHPPLKENDTYPAQPQEGYGWEKLVHEIRCQYYQREYGMEVRIARLDNTYGPEGEYEGGREKAPAALCRKAILAPNGGELEIWGDGQQTRPFMYIGDCVEGIYRLMSSDYREPLNISSGSSGEIISINDLAKIIIKISGKRLTIKHIKGPQGVRGRNLDNSLCKKILNWQPSTPIEIGIEKTYKWIERQINSV